MISGDYTYLMTLCGLDRMREAHRLYVLLIENAKQYQPTFTRKQKKTGYELHHIIPKCKSCGGSKDDQNNQVYLSYREHFDAHRLLAEMYVEKSPQNRDMKFSLRRLIYGNGKEFLCMTPEEYEYVRKLNAEAVSEAVTGIKRSKEQNQRNREAQLIAQNRPEVKIKRILSLTGVKHSQERCQHQSEAQLIAQNRLEVREKIKQTNSCPEVRLHRSKSAKEACAKPETRQRKREANLGEKNPMFGYHYTDEEREQRSISCKNVFSDPVCRQKRSKNAKIQHALRRLAHRIMGVFLKRNKYNVECHTYEYDTHTM